MNTSKLKQLMKEKVMFTALLKCTKDRVAKDFYLTELARNRSEVEKIVGKISVKKMQKKKNELGMEESH